MRTRSPRKSPGVDVGEENAVLRHLLGGEQEGSSPCRLHRDLHAEPGGDASSTNRRQARSGRRRHRRPVRADRRRCPCGRISITPAPSRNSTHLPQPRRKPVDERVRLDVPLVRQVEPAFTRSLSDGSSSWISSSPRTSSEKVGCTAASSRLRSTFPRVLLLRRRADHGRASRDRTRSRRQPSRRRGRSRACRAPPRGRRAVGVVALVAVRPESEQPGRQAREVARPKVEGGVGAHERPQAVDREPGLRQRAGLRGRDPPAVAPR